MKKNYSNKVRMSIIRQATLLLVMIFISSYLFAGSTFQWKRLDINVQKGSLSNILKHIEKETGCNIVYISSLVDGYKNISINKKNSSVEEILEQVLKGTELGYSVENNTITISKETKVMQSAAQAPVKMKISGKIIDAETKKPISGATIIIIGTTEGSISDRDGSFVISASAGQKIEVSFMGKKSEIITISASTKTLDIALKNDEMAVEDVVVTGIYTRPKETFTGSYASFTAKDLKAVGSQNVIQSLKSLDPSFVLLENNNFGADPNRLPNVEIRGKSSMSGLKDQLTEDPNQPLFILNGFETTLRAIYDLNMDRVLSVTLLKDAASTAIYGSKAANGVVVIETIRPKSGELQLSYNGAFNFNAPDLRSYNMMNAAEKLEFERLAGNYNLPSNTWSSTKEIALNQIYYQKYRDILSGVETDWMAQRVRATLNHRHSLYAEGGEGPFTFGIGLGYNGIPGVMKDSKRSTVTGNIDLTYRISKFQFRNALTVEQTSTKDPISTFYDYARTNPYYKLTDSDGNPKKWLEYNDFVKIGNPLWNDSQNSRKVGKARKLINNFEASYNFSEKLKATGKFGYSYTGEQNEAFISKNDTRFTDNTDWTEKGSYNSVFGTNQTYEGDINVSYGDNFGKHAINLVAGGNISSKEYLSEGYDVYGFPEGDFTYPSFAKGYLDGGKSTYNQSISRQVSAYVSGGYYFDQRYLMDFSYRMNGSSAFGSTKRYTGTWAVGLGWNIHNEKFISEGLKNLNISALKIRGSIGNPSNQNFDSFSTLTTYNFDYTSLNYFGMSSSLAVLGNPFLKWQTTIDKNIGLDITMLSNRLTLIVDYYHKKTDPVLTNIMMPSSSGVTSMYANMGNLLSQGITGSIKYYPIYRMQERIYWSVMLNFKNDKSERGGIGSMMDDMNKLGQTNATTERFYDGADPDAIWAVRSLGIDPSTGREIFLDKEGRPTYDYKNEYEVVVGRSRPKWEGYINSNFQYKGFSLNLSFNYRFGGQQLNRTTFEKVENISSKNIIYNQDKRALMERWHKAGDIAPFKDIANAAVTPLSSRFVQDERTFSLENLGINYEFESRVIKKSIGISSLKIGASAGQLFRISTIKAERGIYYPFARTFSFTISATL